MDRASSRAPAPTFQPWPSRGRCCGSARDGPADDAAAVDDLLTRFWSDIADRVGGPLTFRFLFQPAVATLCAMRDGVADARLGRSSYAWALLTHPAERASLIREGARAVGRLLVIGIAMDLLYQLVVLHRLYP